MSGEAVCESSQGLLAVNSFLEKALAQMFHRTINAFLGSTGSFLKALMKMQEQCPFGIVKYKKRCDQIIKFRLFLEVLRKAWN